MPAVPDPTITAGIDDDKKLEELGYIPSFKREFSNLATVCCLLTEFPISSLLTRLSSFVQISFAFSIMVPSSSRSRKLSS